LSQEPENLSSDDTSADIVTESNGTDDEQTSTTSEPTGAEESNYGLPESEFIPKDMYAFFGIPDEEVSDSKTYYIQYTEWIKVNDYYLDTPVIAIWEAGTNRVTIDRMLAKKLISAIEKKYNYKNDKMPWVGAENPSWYHPRIIARISDDKETVMLYQPEIEYYYSEADADKSLAKEFATEKSVFLNDAFICEEDRTIFSVDANGEGYVWSSMDDSRYDDSYNWHRNILTGEEVNLCVNDEFLISASVCSKDLKLGALNDIGMVGVYDIESREKIMEQKLVNGHTYALELTNNAMLYLWDDKKSLPVYYLYDFNTGMTTAYRERFDVSMAERQFRRFGGYKIMSRYFATIDERTLKICDRITGKVTEIYSDEFGEGASWMWTIVMDEDFVSSFITLP
jgi:hypothetical protein